MDQSSNFSIDFVEEKNRQAVKSLMEILNINMKEAYELFISSGQNLEAAIIKKTNPQPSIDQFQQPFINPALNFSQGEFHDIEGLEFQDHADYYSMTNRRGRGGRGGRGGRNAMRGVPMRIEEESQFDTKFNKYLEFKTKKKSFLNNYKIRRQTTESQSIGAKIFQKQRKGRKNKNQKCQKNTIQHQKFKKVLQNKLLNKRCYITLFQGSMSEAVQKSFKQGQPIMIYHLNFDTKIIKQQKKPQKRVSQRRARKKAQIIDITGEQPISNNSMSFNSQSTIQQSVFQQTKKNRFFKQLFLSSKFKDYVNAAYINYAYDIKNYDLESFLKQYFPDQQSQNSYISILRINSWEQIQFIGKINLDQLIQKINDQEQKVENLKEKEEQQEKYTCQDSIQQLLVNLKQRKQKAILNQQQDWHIKKRYQQLLKGNYDYHYKKPMTFSQKKKLKEDRELIKQQQQEFLNVEKAVIEQKINQYSNQERQKKQKVSKQDILAKRMSIRENLKIYKSNQDDLMLIKIRLPSGKNILVNVSKKQSVKYLFDFIYSHQMESMGFEQEDEEGFCDRNFNLVRPEDRMSLQEKLQQSLEDVFEGSTMQSLSIKQK